MLNLLLLVAAVLLVLWVVGISTSFTLGGVIHVLLVLAVAAVVARLVMGRRRVT